MIVAKHLGLRCVDYADASLRMHSNAVRIVANHHNSNIAEVYATQTLRPIIFTIGLRIVAQSFRLACGASIECLYNTNGIQRTGG